MLILQSFTYMAAQAHVKLLPAVEPKLTQAVRQVASVDGYTLMQEGMAGNIHAV